MAADREAPKVDEWQREAAKLPIDWTGDLDDDCTARWAGLTLRAEQMQRGVWWWAVYDDRSGTILGDSNTAEVRVPNGKKARVAAERVARKWLDGVDAASP
jgi:hypothetical protein